MKLSLLPPVFGKLKLGLGHRQSEFWEKTDFKEKQGSYGLAARGKTGPACTSSRGFGLVSGSHWLESP